MEYTEEQVKQIVRDTINATAEGILIWIEKETIIVDKTTKKEVENCELDILTKSKGLMKEYVYPKLKEVGIIFEK